MPANQRGKDLAKRWGLRVRQALYRKTGDWYHQLTKFPGALLDADGDVIFEREELFKACPQLRIGKDPRGMAAGCMHHWGLRPFPVTLT
jgi:hypothetical protein